MSMFRSPGVYIQEVPPQLRAIEGVSTSVAGFVGLAARGPVAGFPPPFAPGVPTQSEPLLLLAPPDPSPVLVTSLSQYTSIFGQLPANPSTTSRNFLGHAVRAFFDNGGQQAYISRIVAGLAGSPATVAQSALATGVALRLTAKAKAGSTTVALDSLRGINSAAATAGASTLVFNTLSTTQPQTIAVATYNTQSNTVTLQAALTQDLDIENTYVTITPPAGAPTFAPQIQATVDTLSGTAVTLAAPVSAAANSPITFSSETTPATYSLAAEVSASASLTLSTSYSSGPNVAGATPATTATITDLDGPVFYARSPGSWGTNVQVLVANSDEAPTQITANVISNVIQVQTSASFYPGAILEVDAGGFAGTRDYFTVVQVVSSTRVQVDRAFVLNLPTTAGVTATLTNGSANVTFANVTTPIPKGAAVLFASQPGVPYVLSAAVAAGASVAGTLTANYTGPTAGGTGVSTYGAFARVVEMDIQITDTASGATETYEGLTWGINANLAVWPSIQTSVQSRHYANVINTQSSLVYVQPPGVEVIPASSNVPGSEAFSASGGATGQMLPLAYQPQSVYTAGGAQACAYPQLLALGGSDGTNLGDGDFIGTDGGPGLRTGIQALQDASEISIIAVPGETAPDIQQALITQCETMLYRFAVLDGQQGPPNDTTSIQNHRNNYASSYAGYYVPWVQIENTAGTATIDLPPSGYVMGIYARVDNNPGVWAAPANQPVQNIVGLQSYITKNEQDILNPVGVNCIRRFPGRGTLVWGARTLSADPQFTYVNVRRYLIFLEASLDEGTQWVVFEPNSPPTWSRVVDTVTAFLNTQFREGALFGLKASDAFYVRCDETTMTADDIQNGRLICDIGVAVVRPAEFVIFRIEQITGYGNS